MIQELINNAAIGATVGVQAGRYAESVNVNKRINLIALGGQVVLDRRQLSVTADGATVTDFTVDGYDCGEILYHSNTQSPNGRAGGQWDTAGVKVTANNVTLNNVLGVNCGGSGVGIGGFEGNSSSPRRWATGLVINGGGAINCSRNGLTLAVVKGAKINSFVNKANNRRKMVMEWESSQKFYICEDIEVIGGQWESNLGPGQWFDYQCRRCLVKRAEFFSNTPWNTTSKWAAVGSQIEISEGPIEWLECWFHDSPAGSSHLAILESSIPGVAGSIKVTRCKFDGGTAIFLRNNGGREPYHLGNIVLQNNEVFGTSFPKSPAVSESGTIIATKAGPPSSWGVTPPPVDPPVEPPVTPPAAPRKAVKIEHVHLVTYDDGKTEMLA